MLKAFVLLLVVACAIAFPVEVQDDDFERRVVGGANAGSGQFPYQVSLRRRGGNSHFCGGSIISSRFILTAAHCLYGQSASNVAVVCGSHLLSSGGYVYDADRLIVHENYNPSYSMNDIALVRVNRDIMYNNLVQKVMLASSPSNAGTQVTLSGWGSTYLGSPAPNNLQYINLKTISLQQCASALQGVGTVYNSNVCTFLANGRGACHGDSGGPLVQGAGQEGIVSWGYPCAKGKPDVFTSVPAFKNWIIGNTRDGPAPIFS